MSDGHYTLAAEELLGLSVPADESDVCDFAGCEEPAVVLLPGFAACAGCVARAREGRPYYHVSLAELVGGEEHFRARLEDYRAALASARRREGPAPRTEERDRLLDMLIRHVVDDLIRSTGAVP